jgi:hypothetical protein
MEGACGGRRRRRLARFKVPLTAPGLGVGLYSRKEEVRCSVALVGSGAVWRGASMSRAEQSESSGECESGRRR